MMDFDDFFTMDKCRLDRLDLEEKKITASHNACMFHLKKHFGDHGWHNLRAFLINRVEEKSNYRLVVTWDDDTAFPNYRIRDRKTYLKEKYNIDWNPRN